MATGRVKLWGTEGILRLLSTQVVVVYQPKIKVSLSQSEFESVRTNFQAAGGFSIDPFGFGGSYNRNTADVSFDASSNTITAQDSTDTPQILAVLSLALPDFT